VAEKLAVEPGLEAITIDRTRGAISVAAVGRPVAETEAERMGMALLGPDGSGARKFCNLLEGGPDCHHCGNPLTSEEERKFTVQQSPSAVTVARVTCPTAKSLWRWRDLPLPRVVQRDVAFVEEEHDADEWKLQLAAAGLCGVLGLAGYVMGAHSVGGLLAFVGSYLAGGWSATGEVLERLRQRAVDVHFLMLAVAAGSAAIGAWEEGATLLFLFSLSGALEHFALGRTQREIRSLFRDAPKVAMVLDASGHEHEVPVEQLRPGSRLLVRPGSQFPVDAEVVKGNTASDESNLTGEAAPVEKGVGDTVLAGTMNLWGAVEAVVLRPASESSLSKIIRLIRDAQQQKAPAQQFTDRFGSWYTYAVLVLTAAMFFVWWLGFGLKPFSSHDDTRSAFYRAMTLLVVASPCALVLSIPSAVLAAIAWGARHGILFRGGAAVEKLAETQVVALDKTGTLTTGELRVSRVESFPAGRELEVAQLAFSLERLSTHPLARAIARHGKQAGVQPVEFDGFESVTGLGLKARVHGCPCRLGRREWVSEAFGGEPGVRDSIAKGAASEPGQSEVWVACGDLRGRVVLRDDIRPQAAAVLNELRREGLRSVVLTGDRREAGEHLKRELGLDDVRSELKPEQKVAAIQDLGRGGVAVAMVGDGVNDAPSLAAAHVGVAMGARGADAALEQAEVVLMHDRLENFLTAFRLSQRARRIIRQNLVVSLGTVAVLVVFAVMGRIPLTLGVVGHEGSTVVVVMNSLRLLFGRGLRSPVVSGAGQE
jgi:Cd2+/Zn2+-exporting ATPase